MLFAYVESYVLYVMFGKFFSIVLLMKCMYFYGVFVFGVCMCVFVVL